MITGDHKDTAVAIARDLNLFRPGDKAIDGPGLDFLPQETLEEEIETFSVYARVTPEHKMRIVRAWQKKGHVVAMTGDGVNDAPALKAADIGCAMGKTAPTWAKGAGGYDPHRRQLSPPWWRRWSRGGGSIPTSERPSTTYSPATSGRF
ncbi:MAG: HAD-IC family P-type ATPase [Evtepia gabavorous]